MMPKKQIPQSQFWTGRFGDQYILRNPSSIKELNESYLAKYGIARTKMNQAFLKDLKKDINILEVGSSFGLQLLTLLKMGFKNLMGIDINEQAIDISRKIGKINVIKGNALDLPFKDNYFDLVFTSGLLIHIAPKNIKRAISEIYRCSRNYIWGFEYYAEKYTQILYRGHRDVLWKTDFLKLYLEKFKKLKLVKMRKFKYKDGDNKDVMFLLKKI